MEIKARYAVIGLFIIAVTAAAFTFVYWLENRGGLGERVSYEVEFPGPVSGLLSGSAVLFNGLRVGEVTVLRLSPENPRAVHATIAVDPGTPVRADTQVSVEFQGLTGVPAITLTGGSATAPLPAPEQGRLPRLVADETAGQSLTDAARQALARIDRVIDDNSGNLSEMIANLNTFAQALGRNADKVDGVMAGLERLTGGGGRSQSPAYDITAVTSRATTLKPLGKQLAVILPTALLTFDSDRVLAEGPQGELTPLEAARWADNLPVLVQTRIVQSFENSGALSEANRPVDGLSADYQLLTEIRRFQLVAGAEPAADVEISAKLLTSDGQVAAVRVFRATAPAKTLSPPDAIAALNAAFSTVAVELVNWTAGAIAAADGAAEPADGTPRGPA